MTTKYRAKKKRAGTALSGVCLALTAVLLLCLLPYVGADSGGGTVRISVPSIPERFSEYMAAQGSWLPAPDQQDLPTPQAAVRKLSDSDLTAPVPNPNLYGEAQTAGEVSWFAEKAAGLLEGQKLYFGPDRELLSGSSIKYYLDDSIAVITWKEAYGNTVMAFAEVKIADGSQFRRFLAGGQFGAETQYTTTQMAQSVNAVLASSGDFYKFRYNGVVVYENTVRRVNTNKADTCYIDQDGNLIFTYQNTKMTSEEAQRFVDEHGIRFSLTFGPVLVDDGMRCEPQTYELGQINSNSPRAALCQLDKLHYLVVTANPEGPGTGAINIHTFAERIAETGCTKAYALDGGQTAAIALDGKLVNYPLYGQQRPISDIIYFATSIDGG